MPSDTDPGWRPADAVDPGEPGRMEEESPRRRHGRAVPREHPEAGPDRLPVKVVHRQGEAVLVEYVRAGRPARATVPAQLVGEDLTADPQDLAMGVPYGVHWEGLGARALEPERLADALRNAGIWTAEDLRTKPRAALGALQAAYGIDLAALNKFTEESHG